MRSGVAIAVSNSIQPPCTRSTRSSAPTTSAPASRASRSLSPFAKTATRTDLPIPCGSTTAPRTIWSACLGSTPSRNDRSTDWSNFVGGMLLRSEEHTSELQSQSNLVCRLLLEKKKNNQQIQLRTTPHHMHLAVH